MNKQIAIVKDLMSKYNLTSKDLFSFCICAVNFLEYYYEEAMVDMMRSCPDRYADADSNNTRAVAGALNGEKKSEGWSDEDQFAHYMKELQQIIERCIKDGRDFSHFLEEYMRFEKVYKREIIFPIMMGCPVEEYDDSKFYDDDYISSIANADNLTIYKASEEQREEELRAYKEREAAELAKEVEVRKNDDDFSVLLASCLDISMMRKPFEDYNKKYYPGKENKIIPLKNPRFLIVQTGGKSIDDVKEWILKFVKQHISFVGYQTREELLPIEKAFTSIPSELVDNKVTHVVTYL